jgi:nicotinamide mononucleotide transporter
LDLSLLSGQIAQQDAVEWAGLITGIAYVILAAYEKPSCWIFGIISSACIAWKSLTDYFLIADVVLQVFYMVIGFVGFIQWVRGRTSKHEKPIISSPLPKHLLAIGIGLLISWPVSWVLITYASARYGYLDTVLTFLSVWATLLLVRKDLHNWIYWIVMDAIFVALYWRSEGYLFSLLFLVYTVISVWGWKHWKGHFARQGAGA